MGKCLWAFAFLVLSGAAQAQTPPQGPLRETYQRLMSDFYEEILTMDAVVEPREVRLKAIENLKSALQTGQPESFRFEPSLSWANAWPAKPLAAAVETKARTFDFIPAPHVPAQDDLHSIKDLESYLKARLGFQAVEDIRSGKVRPMVLGGSEESLTSFLKTSPSQIHKLPGLYQSWGIQKFLTVSADGIPALVYVVPPAREYLEHYQMMLTQLSGRPVPVYRSPEDFKAWRMTLAQGVRDLGKKLGGSFDYVILGYYNQWPEVLSGRILEQKEVILASGHMGRYFFVTAGGRRIRLLTLGHRKTIWGEASAELLAGAFDFRPRGIFFLGSAGSISNQTDVYQISAPKMFRTKESAVQLENLIHLVKGQVRSEVPVRYSAIHGNTSSPASQTIRYLTKHARAGVDTLDVEQSLIASRIEDYNRRHQTKIQFGAVNLITDKPLGHADHDLDKIDHEKKAKARIAAVNLALATLTAEKQKPTQCGRVH